VTLILYNLIIFKQNALVWILVSNNQLHPSSWLDVIGNCPLPYPGLQCCFSLGDCVFGYCVLYSYNPGARMGHSKTSNFNLKLTYSVKRFLWPSLST